MMQKRSIKDAREDFPMMSRQVHENKRLVYLDNASTTQKPLQVIDALTKYYKNYNANIHRAVYVIATEATSAYEGVREKAAKFIGAKNHNEIVFVRGTTEAINMVAYAWGRANISEGDVIVTTEYEHHSNIVPWQMLVKEKKAILKYIDIDDQGKLMLEQLDKHLAEGNVKLVCFSLVSNVLGTISDAKTIISKCKAASAMTLVDAAQAVPHMSVNVEELDCDFFAFSSHKMLGPTGVGVLWARKEILEMMAPFHGGGDMIREVHKQETTWNDVPYKFEAGTPNIADVIGFGAAIDYLQEIGMEEIREHEMEITSYALEKLAEVPGIKVYGTDQMQWRGGVISFNFSDVHPHDVAQIVDEEGIAIRSGHHCAQVLMEKLDVAATSRASFYIYNTKDDVDVLIAALYKVAKVFKL